MLGNSPHLPVDDLGCLSSKFTIGVNRIVEVFAPTVLFWVDSTCYKDAGEKMDAAGSLMVCDASVKHRQYHIGLKNWVGDAAFTHEATVTELCCNGNTGVCAARWALALGCKPVFVVGMEAAYKDGKTDFYGMNRWHHCTEADNGTAAVMRKALDRLLREHPDAVVPVPDGEFLRELADECGDVDQSEVKGRVIEILAAAGAEVPDRALLVPSGHH